MAALRSARRLLVAGLLGLSLLVPRVDAAPGTPTEHQVKAVFVYNFSHFVEWPAETFTAPAEPFFICVLGGDPFAAQLEDAVRGERVNDHPLHVRRYRSIDEVGDCQILFIDQSESAQLRHILEVLKNRSTLTVSDLDGASQRGVMIQFAMDKSRVRLRINVESARAAGLTISSNLLRPAEIVRTSIRD